MISILGIAIPAGLILVGAKHVPALVDELKKKKKKKTKSYESSNNRF